MSLAVWILVFLFCVPITFGANFVVVNTNDAGTGSLRQAISDANINAQADTITFDSVLFSTPKTIFLTTGELEILRDVEPSSGTVFNISIIGPGADILTIDANSQSRVFFADDGNYLFSISGMTLKHGSANRGGAIYSRTVVEISRSVISENVASGFTDVLGDYPAGAGGGIFAYGLWISDSIISYNQATGVIRPASGGVGESGTQGYGGGIYVASGTPQIVNCTFNGNVANGFNAPSAPSGIAGGGGWAYGGAVYFAVDGIIINSRFTQNTAVGGNGGSVTGGLAGKAGGSQGGAVNSSGGRILNSSFVGNSAIGGNGGISTIGSTSSGDGGEAGGGAIYERGLARMANNTLAQNSVAAGSGRVGGNGLGGGLYVGNYQWNIVNLTITNNSVTPGNGSQTIGVARGGGVFSNIEEGGAVPNFRNNIVADNTSAVGKDLAGIFPNASNNLIMNGDGSTGVVNGSNGNIVGTTVLPIDPLLGTLGDHGGVSLTRPLLKSSPAIDAGNNAVFNPVIVPFNSQPLVFDQRNFLRIFPTNGVIDIGAFEFESPSVPITPNIPDLQAASDTGSSSSDNITNATIAVFNISNAIPGAKVELLRNGLVVSSAFAISFSLALTDITPPPDGIVHYECRQTIGSLTSNNSVQLEVVYDNTAPIGAINQAAGQADPTRTTPINYTALFNERVSGAGTITYQGSTANVASAFSSNTSSDGISWNVGVSGVTANGATVVANLNQSTFRDLAGNSGVTIPSTDNSVLLDNVRPTVTVNQAAGQSDPTSALPIIFGVSFSEQVMGFNTSDISFSGSTASVAQATILIAGGPTNYSISIGNVTSSGFVRISIPANSVQDILGNLNLASTSTDNSVTFNFIAGQKGFDFDGDRKSDLSVYRPSNGLWFVDRSTAGGFVLQLGNATDRIAPADYDGDGKTDVAVYRPSQGAWYQFNSATSTYVTTQFGIAEDNPAPGDYDGDGKADLAVFRPSVGTWYIQRSTAGLKIEQFGAAGDVPAPGDYDGDGKNDLVVWRPSNGVWFERRSAAGDLAIQFGASDDKIAPADYDGDGKTDIGIFRPSQGTWYSVNSSNGGYPVQVFGLAEDIPVPADYDGDGKADVGIFRPSTGTWWLNRTTSGLVAIQFGLNGDKPTENAFGN